MLRDFHTALRLLISRPAFTFVAALSLALGIGANSAIFSLLDAFWLRPFDVPRSSEMVRVFSSTDQEAQGYFSYPEFLELQQQSRTLGSVVAVGGRGAIFIDGDSRQLLSLNLVSSNFFTAMGVKPVLGRVFTPEDETAGAPGTIPVVLGNNFWVRQFGGDRAIVGKQLRLLRISEVPVIVIGVLPPGFREIETGADRDLWFPPQSWARLGENRELQTRGKRWFRVLGRLGPGANVQVANAEIQTIAGRLAASWPESNRGRRATVVSDLRYRLDQAGTNGLILVGIVLLVVLISSLNVANLLLSRAGTRGREMAVRLALGATRMRLIRQLMVENLLLGLTGFVLSLFIGNALVKLLPALILTPPGFHDTTLFQFDSRVLAASLAISLATVLLFGLAPAWKSARPNLVAALKGEAAFAGEGRRRWPLRNILVVAQIAVSLALLASAGVLARSFANTRTNELGLARKQLLLVWIAAEDAKPALYRQVVARFEALPGVRSVAIAVRAPMSLSSNGMAQLVRFPQRPDLANQPPFEIKYNSVSANFLSTMGTPLLRGRGFEGRDETGSLRSVLINERMAQRFWPAEDPIGKTMRVGGAGGREHTIIGVVKNAPINAVGEPLEPYLYLPYWANFEQEATFLIETRGDAATLAQSARQALKQVDARMNPLTITTQGELIRFSALPYQLTAELAGALGVLGLLLTAVGLYGVVSYSVAQRTREIGIRMALGAARGDTLRLVLWEVARLGALGVGIGMPLALLATRLISSSLFGVGPWHIPSLVSAVVVLLFALFLAGFIPARRATTIEPNAALRVV